MTLPRIFAALSFLDAVKRDPHPCANGHPACSTRKSGPCSIERVEELVSDFGPDWKDDAAVERKLYNETWRRA